jgi:hypothetical protein
MDRLKLKGGILESSEYFVEGLEEAPSWNLAPFFLLIEVPCGVFCDAEVRR